MLSKILNRDYAIATAANGEDAFELYKKFNPDVIITDLRMPKMDGIQLVKKIRESDQNTKIIITTFKRDIETLIEVTELKLFKYLVKPIDFSELKKVIYESIKELNNYNVIAVKTVMLSDKLLWKRDELELFDDGKIIKLTPKEKKVLNILLSKPNKVLTYEELIYEAWEKDDEVGDRKTLKNIITGLRKKIVDTNIDNVYGFGYKITLTSIN